MSGTFVHLNLRTEFSLVEGIVRIRPLVAAVAAAGMPAVAVTERGNLFSIVKFYRAAIAAGVKPVIGVDLAVRDEADPAQPARIILLCQDQAGFKNLCRLVSRTYLEGQGGGLPCARREWFDGLTDGLIALSGGRQGDVGKALLAERPAEAARHLAGWQVLFPDRYYLELQRTGRDGEAEYLEAAVALAAARDIPVVASNEVCFMARDDFDAHEARVCISEGRVLADPRRPRNHTAEQYLRRPEEMRALFADIPEAIENSVEIAKRCNLELALGDTYLPEFPVPRGESSDSWFVAQARAGLTARLGAADRSAARDAKVETIPRATYDERLQRELDVIVDMGFPGYFLIVADFIRWARDNGVPVGPGRGSGAGSLVAYALGITDLDPLHHDLLFERFLNPERVSLPDFDIDFCMDGRDRVIEYVSRRYADEASAGERVSQIITFGTMAAKAVVRDAGRVLGHPFGFVDQLAKLIPFELGITLDKALEEDALRARYEQEEDARTVIDLARKLEGLARNAGKHAGGVVIAPSTLTDFIALYCEPDASSLVTQLDKDDVEAIGLVKFDFLGLRTLTIIDRALRTINAERARDEEPPIDIRFTATDDPAAYDLIKSGATTAVFQLESRGMKDLIRRLQPDHFDDVVALVALFRPGPLQSGMVDDFIDRKHGRAAVAYPHPDLEPILRPTYGVILYQEQVMQIAQVLAGYTLGGADLLRRAMGKKKAEEMAEQRQVFVDGAAGRGVDQALASQIFDLMEKFAGYGFNKSHSAAYALIAYQTAWLKAHYPAAFMAAVVSVDMDNLDKVVVFFEECHTLGLTIRPPHVNHCGFQFSAADTSTILYGLGAVKGAGESAIRAVIEERDANGPFEDLFDFCQRIDTRKVNRRVSEALIRAGALDGLGPSRCAMIATLTKALQAAEQHERDADAGQNDLFGGAVVDVAVTRQFVETGEWSDEERLSGEKDTLGVYLTGHPINRYLDELEMLTTDRLRDLKPATGRTCMVAGMVVSLRTMNSRNGRMAVVTLDDRSARVDAVVYSELYAQHRELLSKDRLLVVEGEAAHDEFTGGCSVTAQRITDLDGARALQARVLVIHLAQSRIHDALIGELAETMKPFRSGNTPVCVDYSGGAAGLRLPLGNGWRVAPTEELLSRLRGLEGLGPVVVEY